MSRTPSHDTPLLRLLKAAGHTQASLARQLGLDRQQVHVWFVKGRPIPPDWAQRIAPHLRVDPAALVFRNTPGFAEPATSPLSPPPSDRPPVDLDEAFAAIQEAVAAVLTERHLPCAQSDIARISRAVEREIIRLGEMPRFPETLDLRVSEAASKLQRKWHEATASL